MTQPDESSALSIKILDLESDVVNIIRPSLRRRPIISYVDEQIDPVDVEVAGTGNRLGRRSVEEAGIELGDRLRLFGEPRNLVHTPFHVTFSPSSSTDAGGQGRSRSPYPAPSSSPM